MIRVLLVDDEFLVCSYLRQLVDWESYGCRIVGQAANGKEAIEKIRELKPDLVFLDVYMPGMNGLDLIRYLHAEFPQINVVMLSSYSDYHYLREAMKFGAKDYLLKHELDPDYLAGVLTQFTGGKSPPESGGGQGLYKNAGANLPERPLPGGGPGVFRVTIKQELMLINAVAGRDKKSVERTLDLIFSAEREPRKDEFVILMGDLLSLTMKLYRENNIPFPEAGQNEILGMSMEKAREYFSRLLSVIADRPGVRPDFSWAVNSVIEFVQRHYKENIGVTDIGRYCGLNSSYLSTLFKKETGTGLTQYIARVRVKAAVSLMQNRNIPPTQVFELAGFRNYNNFFTLFKEITGLSPKQFKEEAGPDWITRFNPLDKERDISV